MADRDKTEALRRDVEHYEELKRLISDDRTLQALDKMIDKKKSELAQIEGRGAED